ncbi:MAG: hypothetical protein AAF725_02285 [Acidobacteriota bacterium]
MSGARPGPLALRRGPLQAILLAGFLAVLPAAGQDAAGRVTVRLEPEEIRVGERIRAEITVVWMGEEPSEPVRFPTWQDTWGKAEVIEASTAESFEDQSGRFISRQILEITAFTADEITLPARTFAVPLGPRTAELESAPATFRVVSVLPPAGAEEDSDEPLEAKGGAPPVTLGAAGLAFPATTSALLILLLIGLEQLRRRLAADPSGEHGDSSIDPLTLLEPLAELKARLAQLDPQHPGAAHTLLSLTLRRYLARRLSFPAVESTTTEIQRRMVGLGGSRASIGRVGSDLTQRVLQLLQQCDLVKFAGAEADGATVRQRGEAVRDLATALESELAPRAGTEAETEPPEEAAA